MNVRDPRPEWFAATSHHSDKCMRWASRHNHACCGHLSSWRECNRQFARQRQRPDFFLAGKGLQICRLPAGPGVRELHPMAAKGRSPLGRAILAQFSRCALLYIAAESRFVDIVWWLLVLPRPSFPAVHVVGNYRSWHLLVVTWVRPLLCRALWLHRA